jgi:hypothetical protein
VATKKRPTKTGARKKMLERAKKIQARSSDPGSFSGLISWLTGKTAKRKGGKR